MSQCAGYNTTILLTTTTWRELECIWKVFSASVQYFVIFTLTFKAIPHNDEERKGCIKSHLKNKIRKTNMTSINIHSLCSLLFLCNDVVFLSSFSNSSPQVQSIWITAVSAQPFSDPFRHIQSGSSLGSGSCYLGCVLRVMSC